MPALRADLSNSAYPVHHLVNPEMFGKESSVKCLYIPSQSEPTILTNHPKTMIKDVFGNSKTEILSINDYIHARVDAHAIAKNLPINVYATHFFRDYFHIYSMCAIVYRTSSCFWIS